MVRVRMDVFLHLFLPISSQRAEDVIVISYQVKPTQPVVRVLQIHTHKKKTYLRYPVKLKINKMH